VSLSVCYVNFCSYAVHWTIHTRGLPGPHYTCQAQKCVLLQAGEQSAQDGHIEGLSERRAGLKCQVMHSRAHTAVLTSLHEPLTGVFQGA